MSSLSESEPAPPLSPLPQHEDPRRVSLCEALDRMLNQGVVVAGEVVISVADIDLIYLNLQALLTSVETAYRQHRSPGGATSTSPHQS
jgi:hypothetical protein